MHYQIPIRQMMLSVAANDAVRCSKLSGDLERICDDYAAYYALIMRQIIFLAFFWVDKKVRELFNVT